MHLEHRPKESLRTPTHRRNAAHTVLAVVALAILTSLMVASGGISALPVRDHSGASGAPASPLPLVHPSVSSSPAAVMPAATSTPVWMNATGTVAPSPRFDPAMAYDPAIGAVVLFGGGVLNHARTGYVYPSDTWTFVHGAWTNISASVGVPPPGRSLAQLTYDPQTHLLVLAGGWGNTGASGQCVSACDDLWTFNGSAWSSWALPIGIHSRYPGQGLLQTTYDSSDGYLLVVFWPNGNPTTSYSYSYASGAWSNLSANTTVAGPTFAYGGLVDDPTGHGVVYFSEQWGPGGTMAPDTWTFQAGNWTDLNLSVSAQPPAGTSPAFAFDPVLGEAVLFSYNFTGTSAPGVSSTWAFNGTWNNITPSVQPPNSAEGTMAWDDADNASVLFGGTVSVTFPPELLNTTWEFTSSPGLQGLSIHATADPVDTGVSVVLNATFHLGTGPFTYAWNLGDGTLTTVASPSHAYGASGNYTANVTVTDAAGHVATASEIIVVVPALTASPGTVDNPGDAGVAIPFSAGIAGGTSAVSYSWLFGDGSSSPAAGPSHDYGASGSYHVQLWANDSGGGQAYGAFVEVVHAALSVSISANPSQPAVGQLVNFSASASGGTAPYVYAWAFGDGGTGGNLANISHIFTTNGPFSARVTVTDPAGGETSASINLTVALNLTILGSWHLGASPLPVSFQSIVHGGVPGYTYGWSFGDGGTSSLPSATHTYTAAGNYVAILTVVDRVGHVGVTSWAVLVAPGGGPISVGLSTATPTLSVGAATMVEAAISGGSGGYTVSWQAPYGLTCDATALLSEKCTSTEPGTYLVGLVVSDAAGTSARATTTLIVTQTTSVQTPPSPLYAWDAVGPWLGGAMAGAVAVALAGALLGRRRRRSPPAPYARDPLYRGYASGADGVTGTPSGSEAATSAETFEGFL